MKKQKMARRSHLHFVDEQEPNQKYNFLRRVSGFCRLFSVRSPLRFVSVVAVSLFSLHPICDCDYYTPMCCTLYVLYAMKLMAIVRWCSGDTTKRNRVYIYKLFCLLKHEHIISHSLSAAICVAAAMAHNNNNNHA